MSVVEDSRKLLQDFVAPELRAIDARLTALEKRFDLVDARFTAADKTEQDRFTAADKTEQDRFTAADKTEQDRFTAADRTEQDRFAVAEKMAAERHERVFSELKQIHNEHDIEIRLVKIEAMMSIIKTEKLPPEARQ